MTILDLDVAPVLAGRRRPVVPSRPVALLVLLAVTLALVTGSARRVSPFGGVRWSGAYDRDTGTMTLTPGALFVTHRGRLTAYDPATGAVRWSAPATDVLPQVPTVAGGVLVAPDAFERYFQQPDLVLARTTRTVARDARTGAVLWRAAGGPQDVTDRSVLLVDTSGAVTRLSDVGLHDGRSRWSRPVPGLATAVVLGDTVVTAAGDGRLTVLRYGDGAFLRTERVPWPGRSWLSVAAGRLVVTSQGPAGLTKSTVYRPGTLAELWRADGNLTDCGSVLCRAEAGGLSGYDPDTGARRWQVPGMTVAWPVSGDRIVVSSELNGRFRVLDPATGRPIGPAGAGVGSWATDGRSVVTGAPAASALVLRREPAIPGRMTVVRLDLRTGRPYLAGAVAGGGWLGCRGTAGYFVCSRGDGFAVTSGR